jgi:hypothetical protein
LGDAGELAEHLLVFGMGLDEAEKNLRRKIAVPLGLVPGLADDAAVVSAQRESTLAVIIGRVGGDGNGDSGRGGCRLKKIFQTNEQMNSIVIVGANKLGLTTLAKATTAKRRASLKAILLRVKKKSLALEVSFS